MKRRRRDGMELHGGYRHKASEETGRDVKEWIDFSANINPFGMPDKMKEAIKNEIEFCTHYPDPSCTELIKAIAKKEEVEAERIFCGNGGADVLYRYLSYKNPKKILLPVPTFVEYEFLLKSGDENREIHYYFMEQQKDRDRNRWRERHLTIGEELLGCLKPSFDLLILCSPNNPTGHIIKTDLLEKIVGRTKQYGIDLLLDFSFIDFVKNRDKNLEQWLKNQSHVTILHSFTKMYGIAGLRLGYAVLEQRMNQKVLDKYGSTWSVNHLAQVAGIAALKEDEWIEKTIAYIEQEKAFLEEELEKMGIFYIHGSANYILFQKKEDMALDKRLMERGILIRNCQNYVGLSGDYYRIAIRTHKENEYFIEQLKEVY